MELVLDRAYFEAGTNGVLSFKGNEVCKTIELPDLNNMPQQSCIPVGRYELRKRYSPKFQWHIEVLNVQHRELILLHPANDALLELRGCIAPVTSITGHGKGSESRLAMQKVKDLVYPVLDRNEPVYLTVQDKPQFV